MPTRPQDDLELAILIKQPAFIIPDLELAHNHKSPRRTGCQPVPNQTLPISPAGLEPAYFWVKARRVSPFPLRRPKSLSPTLSPANFGGEGRMARQICSTSDFCPLTLTSDQLSESVRVPRPHTRTRNT